jgi:endonuclease/exonuclease/phosphatase family metal-dependent hydrolase
MAKSKTKKFRWWKIPIAVVAVILCVAIVYVAYVFISYNRIEDNQPIEVVGTAANDSYKVGEEYTAMCYNIGFGAYTPDFTFFMDGGTQSWANSKESVINCTNGDISLIKEYNADIVCLQEVDFDSTRSYHVDQAQMFRDALPQDSSAQAVNYHSAFLFYPFTQPHGASNSSLMTFSNAQITDSLRRSLPISTGVSKLVDLDRCYSISRVKVENDRQLVIFNTHLSAYGTDGDLQTQQLSKLFGDMKAEYDMGNYVICAGDYNHDFLGNSKEYFNENPKEQTWAAPFPDEMIPEHFAKVTDYASGVTTPSCRDCDVPYTANHSGKTYSLAADGSYDPACFTVTLDGFIVSDNVETTFVDVINNEFLYSDHNPVVMKFKLK